MSFVYARDLYVCCATSWIWRFWWPESVSQAHNDVDLALIDPWTGETWSAVGASVFEKIQYEEAVLREPGR